MDGAEREERRRRWRRVREVTASPPLGYTQEAPRFCGASERHDASQHHSFSEPSGHRWPKASTQPCSANLSLEEYSNRPDEHHRLLVAAWLHHRFAQIHPFADGNGRVTRALVTWHLFLPIVVTRYDRSDYINALEAAADGDLKPLVAYTTGLHRRTVRRPCRCELA